VPVERDTLVRNIPDVSKVCSVYRRSLGEYDYYEVSAPPVPKAFINESPIGIALSDALPALPRSARRIGHGVLPIGTIATDDEQPLGLRNVVIGAVIAGAVSAIVAELLRDDNGRSQKGD